MILVNLSFGDPDPRRRFYDLHQLTSPHTDSASLSLAADGAMMAHSGNVGQVFTLSPMRLLDRGQTAAPTMPKCYSLT